MALPISYQKQITSRSTLSTEQFRELFMEAMPEELKKIEAKRIQVEGNTISFKAGIRALGTSLHSFSNVTSGRLEIGESNGEITVNITLWFTGLLVVFSALFLAGLWVVFDVQRHIVASLAVLCFIAAWFFVLFHLMAAQDFCKFVERTLRKIEKGELPAPPQENGAPKSFWAGKTWPRILWYLAILVFLFVVIAGFVYAHASYVIPRFMEEGLACLKEVYPSVLISAGGFLVIISVFPAFYMEMVGWECPRLLRRFIIGFMWAGMILLCIGALAYEIQQG